jgi:aminopeptidase N
VKASCAGGKGKLELAQSRYLPLGSQSPSESLWQIPVCVRTDGGSVCTMLAGKTGVLDLDSCPPWIMPNVGGAGYYRSALEDEALSKLTKNAGKLTVSERMVVFADADAAAHAGAADFSRTLQLVQTLSGDKDRHVVELLLAPLRFVRSRAVVADDQMPKFAALVRNAFGKRARTLGFAEKKGEPEDTRILRPSLLRLVGDEGGDQQLRTDAQKLALRWLADHKATSPDLASAALYLSAIDADALLWDQLHAAAKAETGRVERQRILEGMGAVRNLELVQKNLALFLTDEFDPREATALLGGALSDPHAQEALFAFIQKNFDAIDAKMPKDFGSRVPFFASNLCSDEQAAAVAQFFRPKVPAHPGMDRTLAQAVEEIRQCAAFKAKQAPALAAFLTR